MVIDTQFMGEAYEAITALSGAEGRVALLRMGGIKIEVFEFKFPQAKAGDSKRPVCDHGITHLCFEVTDIWSEYERLKAAGVTFHCEPLSFGAAKATYGRDPDGNVFELLEVFDVEVNK